MMLRGALVAVAIIAASPLYAQVDDTVIIGGDTLVYRYTPIDQTTPTTQWQGRESGRSVLDYLTFGDDDINPGASVTIMGAPSYSVERGWGLAIAGDMHYRTRQMTEADTPSSLRLRLAASLTGYYAAELLGHNMLGGNKHTITYSLETRSEPTYTWGIDYATASGNVRGEYTAKRYAAYLAYCYRPVRHVAIGAHVDFIHTAAVRPSDTATQLIGNEVMALSTVGVGVDAAYDTRRAEEYVMRGVYIAGSYTLRPRALASNISTLHSISLTFDYYQPLWRGATAAIDLYGEYHSAATPWLLRAEAGGDYRLRGYYEGRYMGNRLLTTQLELRQHIWQGLVIAAWGGGGIVLAPEESFAWRRVLPTYGVGVRWSLGGLSAIRVDVAFGRDSRAIIFGMSEAF